MFPHKELITEMKHQHKLTFFIILTLLSITACTSKNFIPLYPDEKHQNINLTEQTALLIAPIQTDLVYHNNKRQNFTPPYKATVKYRLLPGKHLLGFRYQDLHTNEENDQEIITSKIVLLDFVAEPGKTYKVTFERPENFVAAKKIEEKFEISLSHNDQIIATSTYAVEKIYEENDISLDEGDLPASQNKTAAQQLKFWWTKASKAEQEAFGTWAETNKKK